MAINAKNLVGVRTLGLKRVTLAFIIVIAAGCESLQPQYYWNSYEGLIYDMYHKPGKATPAVQIQKLTEDIQRAESKGMRIPPGVYAHLGFMYAADGNLGKAEEAFIEEKTLFPESATLIDGMFERAKKSASENSSS